LPEHILTTKGTMPKPEAISGASIPEYIEIKTATGDTVAFLSPESDSLKECWVDDEQNGTCTLEMELPLTSEKWQYLTDQYRIYADGKEFVILNPDAVDKQRDGQKLKGKIKAHESWVLLGKKYATVCNDPLIGTPPWGAVIIVSGGAAHGGYDAGSAGSALSYLLQGTGWIVGTVDVTGTYDLETEKESVLYNINQVQEKWGGILIWDSVNKTVSLRDEATYKPYTGYQIRYAKNLKGITRTDDYDIVTRLYPFGENDLNIANVNGGLLYLDNHSYSDDILEGVWYNQDIADQTQLKVQGEKQLAVMCKPRHNYKTEMLDLRSLPGYGHETFKRSDMVDLFDEDFGVNAQVRIIRYRHNVFQPWLCDMELGDPLEKIQATVAQTVLMAKFYKNVVAPNTSFQNLLKAIINTAATEINGASGDYTLVDGVSTWFDRDSETGELTGKLLRITPQGLIISHDGGQTWKLAISGEGIHAEAGWVGKLNAGVVTIGADTTFEAGYDPTQISSTSMGADSDCVGLWHFDGSLNSHKGVAAIGDANFDTGCFGQAVNVEEGTINLISNPDFEGGTDGWILSAAAARSNADSYIGSYSLALTNPAWPQESTYNITGIAPSTAYTFSVYVKSSLSFIRINVIDLNGTTALNLDVRNVSIHSAENNNTWKRYTLTWTTDANADGVQIRIICGEIGNSGVAYLDGFQLEQKPYATPFVNGTRLGELKAPTTGLSPTQGTINFRAKNLAESPDGRVLIDLPKSDNTQGLQVGIANDGKICLTDDTTTVYGPDKSTLTAWDSISLAWKPERLSLVVNDAEVAHIENPGLPTAFGSYLFIGTDRNGANAINTLVDELRIDKVYREVNIRTGWHKTGVPFYTSEDMKQWPGYMRLETDGLKVYDPSEALRVLLGSWIDGAIRKYGLKVIGGEIYSAYISTKDPSASTQAYTEINPNGTIKVYDVSGQTGLELSGYSGQGMVTWYFGGTRYADAFINGGTPRDLVLWTMQNNSGITLTSWNDTSLSIGSGGYDNIILDTDYTSIEGTLNVQGEAVVDSLLAFNGKNCVEFTENYGPRLLYARESPDNKYLTEGLDETTNESCRIELDPMFLECIEQDDWIIHLTPYSQANMWVDEIGRDFFVVKATADTRFAWTLSAYRKNYKDIYLPEFTQGGDIGWVKEK